MRKRVYIAGPMSIGDRVDNLNMALRAMRDLTIHGFAPLSPQLTFFIANVLRFDHDTWIQIDLPWVSQADAILRLPGESKGADEEVKTAIQYNVPVFSSIEKLKQHFRSKP